METKEYKPYTGIGSRATPAEVGKQMTEVASMLAQMGFTLRSGAAEGADSAFEAGAGNQKEIFLAWRGFNGSHSPFYNIPKEAFKIAESLHPAWGRLSQGAQKLHARNIQQILGHDLTHPSLFVIFYAPEKAGIVQGGTATAVKLARAQDIPTHNLWVSREIPRFWEKKSESKALSEEKTIEKVLESHRQSRGLEI
jgi:hypothetical protein